VHPAQDDLRGSVPAGHHIPGHLDVCLPRQTKVQDLTDETQSSLDPAGSPLTQQEVWLKDILGIAFMIDIVVGCPF